MCIKYRMRTDSTYIVIYSVYIMEAQSQMLSKKKETAASLNIKFFTAIN